MGTHSKVHCIEIIVWACGCIISWDKFFKAEGEHQALEFLRTTFNDPSKCPSFVAFDQAYRVMLSIGAHDEWKYLIEWFKLIVDAWHFEGHSANDMLCREFCDLALLDGRLPDLVIPLIDPAELEAALASPDPATAILNVARRFHRAFNTEVRVSFISLPSPFPLLKR